MFALEIALVHVFVLSRSIPTQNNRSFALIAPIASHATVAETAAGTVLAALALESAHTLPTLGSIS